MSQRLIIKPAAEADLQEAVSWYERQRPGLGEEFLEAVEQAFAQLTEKPYLFPVVHRDIHRALTKRFPYGLYYLIEQDAVVVLGVFHASRAPAPWQERRG